MYPSTQALKKQFIMTTICKNKKCRKIIDSNQKYCDTGCQAEAQRNTLTVICEYCRITIESPYYPQQRFCSFECTGNYKKEKNKKGVKNESN